VGDLDRREHVITYEEGYLGNGAEYIVLGQFGLIGKKVKKGDGGLGLVCPWSVRFPLPTCESKGLDTCMTKQSTANKPSIKSLNHSYLIIKCRSMWIYRPIYEAHKTALTKCFSIPTKTMTSALKYLNAQIIIQNLAGSQFVDHVMKVQAMCSELRYWKPRLGTPFAVHSLKSSRTCAHRTHRPSIFKASTPKVILTLTSSNWQLSKYCFEHNSH